MDCMNIINFYNERLRMCKSMNLCSDCKLSNFCASAKNEIVLKECKENLLQAVKIVQNWSDKNLVKTNLDILKENYPDMIEGYKMICPNWLGLKVKCEHMGCCTIIDKVKCWKLPAESEERKCNN